MGLEGIDTSRLLVEAMKVAHENHRVISNNIANVDTPNFTPSQLDFQKTLRNAIDGRGHVSLRKTSPRHLDGAAVGPEFEGLAFLSKNDYNKVDLDSEMANLSQNSGNYVTYGSLLVKQFDEIKTTLTALR